MYISESRVAEGLCDIPLKQTYRRHEFYKIGNGGSLSVTNAFGITISVVWIQSLGQPNANNTGGNYLREQRWPMLLFARVTKWQNGTESGLEEINVCDDKPALSLSTYASLQNVICLHTWHHTAHWNTHLSPKPKTVSWELMTIIHPRMWWLHWIVCVYQTSAKDLPWHSKCQSDHGNTCTINISSSYQWVNK